MRSGFELSSELAETRLSTGAVVKVGTNQLEGVAKVDVDPIFCECAWSHFQFTLVYPAHDQI